MDETSKRVQDLPRELFDKIYVETFTADGKSCKIDDNYTPPKLLQIDRASRALFAQSYYDQTTFVFDNSSKLKNWLRSLHRKHRVFLREVRMIYNCSRHWPVMVRQARHIFDAGGWPNDAIEFEVFARRYFDLKSRYYAVNHFQVFLLQELRPQMKGIDDTIFRIELLGAFDQRDVLLNVNGRGALYLSPPLPRSEWSWIANSVSRDQDSVNVQ